METSIEIVLAKQQCKVNPHNKIQILSENYTKHDFYLHGNKLNT
jgi:hypothetical protein